jgi:hypothetical protein
MRSKGMLKDDEVRPADGSIARCLVSKEAGQWYGKQLTTHDNISDDGLEL